MDPFDYGDPYVEWEELNAAREEYDKDPLTLFFIEEKQSMSDVQNNLENIQSNLKGEVTTLLVTKHDFSIEEAEEAVAESFASSPGSWGENVDAKDLANYLANDDDDA